jgi:energy-coupling factor transport system ATP-binding protein
LKLSDAIVLENLWFTYDKINQVLRNINLSIKDGEFVAIIGNNGSGKSTLLKLVVGLIKPTRGRVLVDGVDTRTSKVSDLARKIGFFFQNPNDQLFASTVRDEIAFGLKNLNLNDEVIRERVEEAVKDFQLEHVQDVFPRFLARGDKQKVCLASIIVMGPRIILLDEPTTGQDHRDSRAVMDLAKKLNERGITIILVTHQMINVAEYATRTLLLNNGELAAEGPTREVLGNVELMRACDLLPPQITRLSISARGLGFDGKVMTVQEMVEAVRRLNGA